MIDAQREITLTVDEPTSILPVPFASLTSDEVRALRRLATVSPIPERDEVHLKRNTLYQVGKCRISNWDVIVPPELPSAVFLQLMLYALGVDSTKYLRREVTAAAVHIAERSDFFLRLMAALLVRIAESSLTQRVVRTYEPLRERARVVRGRPVWTSDFGRRRSDGITCDLHRMSEDNQLNRIVLAGLIRSTALLRGTPEAERCSRQVFIWRTIAAETTPQEEQFRQAGQQMTRITEHYRPAVTLSRALVLGFTPEDIFARARDPLQGLDFSLPYLFELMVLRFLRAAASRLTLRLDFQVTDKAAFVDGTGRTYRSVQPDIVVYRRGRPVCVLDAKFKSRYVSGHPHTDIPYSSRVTNADLYQLFFYQARLQHQYGLRNPPLAVVIAPILESSEEVWDESRRQIRWRAGGVGNEPHLRVVPFPLVYVLERLGEGEAEDQLLNQMGELRSLILAMSEG